MNDLAIAIVNYNSRPFLESCLCSLQGENAGLDMEVWVVDNSSQDGSTEMVKKKFPHVRLIENKKNVGFAAANNQVLRQTKARYVLLLNSDTIVKAGTLKAMVAFLEKNPWVGIVGCKVLNPGGTIQGSARRFPDLTTAFFGRASLLTRLFPQNPITRRNILSLVAQDEPMEVDWVSGACLMIRAEVYREVGLLDEGFFMFWEDADWCYRAKEAGWQVYYLPGAEVVHHVGMGGRRKSKKAIIEFHRSVYRYYRKHISRWAWNPFNLLIAIFLLIRMGVQLGLNLLKPESSFDSLVIDS